MIDEVKFRKELQAERKRVRIAEMAEKLFVQSHQYPHKPDPTICFDSAKLFIEAKDKFLSEEEE